MVTVEQLTLSLKTTLQKPIGYITDAVVYIQSLVFPFVENHQNFVYQQTYTLKQVFLGFASAT